MHTMRTQIDLPKLLRETDSRLLSKRLARLDDVQIASQVDNLAADDQERIFQSLPVDRRPEVFGHLRYETAADILRRWVPEEGARLLDDLESDDIADILGRLDEDLLREILSELEPDDADEIEELLAYDDESAGGIMSPEFIAVADSASIAETIRTIQEVEDPPDHAFQVYVVDEDDRLTGLVSLHALLTARPSQPIRDVMEVEFVSVQVSVDQEEVAEIASRYDLVAVPVVDDKRHLVGVVTIDDILDVIREEATEDILKMAGAGEMLVDTRSYWSSFRARFPWLFYAATGGMFVALVLTGFETTLQQAPALALFMPVVAGMGGNVGTQSSTIVVRGLAVGYVESSKLTRLVRREVALGAGLGLIYGILIAFAAPNILGSELVSEPWALAGVLTGGMIGSMTIAAAVGSSVPLLMDRFGVDPAIATGPFVTTAVDALGLMFYFWLATKLMGVG